MRVRGGLQFRGKVLDEFAFTTKIWPSGAHVNQEFSQLKPGVVIWKSHEADCNEIYNPYLRYRILCFRWIR